MGGLYEFPPDTRRSGVDIGQSNQCIDNAPRSWSSPRRRLYRDSRRDHSVEEAHLESSSGTEAILGVETAY